jgi:hypothetical protein
LDVGIEILVRIVDVYLASLPSDSQISQRTFSFLLHFVHKFGISASIAFRNFNLCRLSSSQLAQLRSNGFTAIGNDSILNVLSQFVDLAGAQRRLLEESRSQIDEFALALRSRDQELNSLKSEISELKGILAREAMSNRLSSVESGLPAIDRRLASVEHSQQGSVASVDELRVATKRIEETRVSTSDFTKLVNRLSSLIVAPFCGSPELHGIVAHLTERFKGNVHEKGVIEIRGIEHPGEGRKPWYAVDFKVQQYPHDYCSENKLNSWLLLDFKEMRILPTHYAIRSYYNKVGTHHLKSRKVVGFAGDDGDGDGIVLDSRENTSDLNGPGLIGTFPMRSSGVFKSIKLISTGPGHCGYNFLIVSGFELYGTLFNAKSAAPSSNP